MNPLMLFDTSRGIVIVEEIAKKMIDISSDQKNEFLESLKQETISFLEANKGDYNNLQKILYSYAVDLYRTANYITALYDEVFDYLQATAKPIFEWFRNNGLQLHMLVANDFSDFTRPLNAFPDFFSAAGLPYISPINIAYELMKKDGYQMSNLVLNYVRYKEESMMICKDLIAKLSNEHYSYIFVDPNENTTDDFDVSLSFREKDGHLVAIKTSGPEDGKGSLIYSNSPRQKSSLKIMN